jgi:hypothetical protein
VLPENAVDGSSELIRITVERHHDVDVGVHPNHSRGVEEQAGALG